MTRSTTPTPEAATATTMMPGAAEMVSRILSEMPTPDRQRTESGASVEGREATASLVRVRDSLVALETMNTGPAAVTVDDPMDQADS